MEEQKKMIIGMTVISIFVLLVGISSFYVQTQIDTGNACGCIIPISLFIPFLASVGLLIGTLVYYFFNPIKNGIKIKRSVFMKLFTRDEREVIGLILGSKGEVLQSRLVSGTGLGKVKVFRVLERLIERGVVRKEPYGRTNRIVIDSNIAECVE